LKQATVDHTVWRTRFGRLYGYLDVFLTVHHELTILCINHQLDALIIIYS